jgi:hypothetical protein
MDYDSHPLSNHLSLTLDILFKNVSLEPKAKVDFNLFDVDHIIPDDIDFSHGISQSGESIKDPSMAFQSVMRELGSLPRNRSYIYDLIYSFYCDSVDIGSGLFNKGLESYRHLDYYNGPRRLLLDIKDSGKFPIYDTMGTQKINYRQFDMNSPADQEFFVRFMQSHPDFLVTSVNSLMYKEHGLEPYSNYDMLYTLPDPHIMLKQGKIIMLDARKYRFVDNKEEEYSHAEQLDSEPGEMQALAINLASRKVKIQILKEEEIKAREEMNLLFDLCRRPVRLSRTTKDTLVGPYFKKIDGITMIIARRGGFLYTKTSFEFKIYNVIEISGGGPFSDFEIEGEYIEKAKVFILHSVYYLGELSIPAFMKKIEKEFIEKYQIEGLPFRMYSKKTYITIDHCLCEKEKFGDYEVELAEGVIGFVEGKRHIVAGKVMESIDVTSEIAASLKRDFQDNYDQEIHVVNLDGGICEYILFRVDEIIYLKAIRARKDKLKPNNYERCVKMIMDLMLSQSHDLIDYISDDTLALYGISKRNN